MQSSDETMLGGNDQDGHAIGTDNTQQDVAISRDHTVCFRSLVPNTARPIYHDDVVAMHLSHRT
jgi:hypothetical protein